MLGADKRLRMLEPLRKDRQKIGQDVGNSLLFRCITQMFYFLLKK